MRKIKRLPFNEQVLQRMAEKRSIRRTWIFRIAICLLWCCQIGVSVYFSYSIHHYVPSGITVSSSAAQTVIDAVNEDGLPIALNINGESWKVVRAQSFTKEMADNAATTSCQLRTIFYLPEATPSLLRNDLAHEVFHAGACLHGGDTWWNSINPDNVHHDGIYHLADFWTNFAHANPEFMVWLSK
jgi:hypothetical protein